MSKLFNLIRKRGTLLSLRILFEDENGKMKRADFYKEILKSDYLNAFFRIRDALDKYGLVKYELDKNNEIEIHITDSGRKLMESWMNMEKLFPEEEEEQ